MKNYITMAIAIYCEELNNAVIEQYKRELLNSEPKVSSKIINPASSGDLEQVLQKLRSSNPMEITDALELIDNQHLTGAIDALEYLLNDQISAFLSVP